MECHTSFKRATIFSYVRAIDRINNCSGQLAMINQPKGYKRSLLGSLNYSENGHIIDFIVFGVPVVCIHYYFDFMCVIFSIASINNQLRWFLNQLMKIGFTTGCAWSSPLNRTVMLYNKETLCSLCCEWESYKKLASAYCCLFCVLENIHGKMLVVLYRRFVMV